MSTATPPVTVQPPTKTAADPAIYKILDDGTVLYRTYQQAESAKLLQAGSQPDTTAKKMSQVKYGEMYLTKDGQTVPYTLGSLAEFQLTGLIVVIVVLSGLSIICAALGRLIKSLDCGAVSESAIPSPALEQPPPPASLINTSWCYFRLPHAKPSGDQCVSKGFVRLVRLETGRSRVAPNCIAIDLNRYS
jgi:hypothetical protein